MLAFSMAILQVGFGMVVPVFPYYVQELGMGGTELGALTASFALSRIVLSGPMGRLSDRVGRKPVLLFSLIGFGLSNLVYAMADTVIVMIAARAAEGAISAGFFPAANAFVSDVTTVRNRGSAMGRLNVGNMVGMVLGPVAGGMLAGVLGVRLPFVVASLLAFGTMLSVHLLLREPPRLQPAPVSGMGLSRRGSGLTVMSQHPLAFSALMVTSFASTFSLGVLQVALVLDVIQNPRPGLVVTPMIIGVMFGMVGVVTAAGSVAFGKASDRLGRKWLIVSGSLAGALAMGMFLSAQDNSSLFAAALVLSISMSLHTPTLQALIADLTDRSAYGSVMGVLGAVTSLAMVLSPLVGGYLFDQMASSSAALTIGLCMMLGAALYSAFSLPDGRRLLSENGLTCSQLSLESGGNVCHD